MEAYLSLGSYRARAMPKLPPAQYLFLMHSPDAAAAFSLTAMRTSHRSRLPPRDDGTNVPFHER